MKESWHQKAVALTGTTGSGKTTVSNLLRQLGVDIVSADALAREVVAPGSAGLKKVIETFGSDFLLPNGELDRKRLGQLVFSDPKKRLQLESITHPLIRFLAAEQAAQSKSSILVYDCPLLFESGLDEAGFRKIILVTAAEATCIKRICQRDKISEADAKARIANQFSEAKKRAGSDVVIENNGTLEELANAVSALYQTLLPGPAQP